MASSDFVAKNNKFDSWEAEQFFRHLAGEILRQRITETERMALIFGLKYLETEAKRGRGQRDKEFIKYTWSQIQPLLDRCGMMAPFRSAKELRRRIKFFVTDRML